LESTGKTFISSYVIGKVLKETPDGRVVIVLPTKALVNQLTAQVRTDPDQLVLVYEGQ
jgi:ERCC4-related helicase